MPKKSYETNVAIAAALDISRQRLHTHRRTYGWPPPPWTTAQLANFKGQLADLWAVAPNGYPPAVDGKGDHLGTLTASAKIKLLSERIRALETDNAERAGKLVPKELIAEGRLTVIKQFKGTWDHLESRAYELVGLDGAGIERTIHGWANEFYEAIGHEH